jgi:hypothetical protein
MQLVLQLPVEEHVLLLLGVLRAGSTVFFPSLVLVLCALVTSFRDLAEEPSEVKLVSVVSSVVFKAKR